MSYLPTLHCAATSRATKTADFLHRRHSQKWERPARAYRPVDRNCAPSDARRIDGASQRGHVHGKDDQRSDPELVSAVNGGDWAAFDVLYFRYRDWVYRLAWRFCRDETDAHDVVQEVFVYLAGKFRGHLELRAGLTTLLYPAVKHTALAIKRKRRRAGETLPDEIDVPAVAEGGDHRKELSQALRALSDPHREIVLMRFVDGMSLEEMAEALAIPLGTAKSRLHHALAALRDDPHFRKYAGP